MTVIILEKLVVIKVSRKLCCIDTVARDVVLEILYVLTSSVPTVFRSPERITVLATLCTHLLKSLLTKNNRFHTSFVQTVSLCEVQYVELNLSCFFGFVDNFEVEPLRVALCVEIVFKPKVVFDVVDFGSLSEITRLETAVENEHVV
jgi:hypothetical protein